MDLFFVDPAARADFALYEEFAKRLTALLDRAPQIPAAAEFIVRRAHYDPGAAEGYYFTFELAGYGDDDDEAKKRWVIALKLIANAILQISTTRDRATG